MSKIWLLPEGGSFYKANLHCHTVLSDGCWTPEEVKRAYRDRGYSIVAYTDHNHYHYHRALCDGSFLALAALEVNIDGEGNDWNTTPVYHLNFYDTQPETRNPQSLPPPPRRYTVAAVNAYIAEMNRAGFLCCYNHPWWSLQTWEDYAGLKGIAAFEIYNHGCERDGLYGYAPQAYDDLLRAGQRAGCFATDDNHNRHPVASPLCDSFGGFTAIKAGGLSYAAVIKALKSRAYYASMGPEIHSLSIEDQMLAITCSPVEKIYVTTAGRNGYSLLSPGGDTLTRAEFALSGREGYIRVDCRDAHGRHANSCAYYIDEILPGR